MRGKLCIAVGVGVIIMTGFVSQAAADCETAKGKITNNGQPDGSTLGVVALRLGHEKHKCAIVGAPQFPGPPNFRHTVVCDNKAGPDEAQAQVTFDTSFTREIDFTGYCDIDNPWGPVSFSFEEFSIPDPDTARGSFEGVTNEGGITITGDFNCDGGIVMKFNGSICFDEDED